MLQEVMVLIGLPSPTIILYVDRLECVILQKYSLRGRRWGEKMCAGSMSFDQHSRLEGAGGRGSRGHKHHFQTGTEAGPRFLCPRDRASALWPRWKHSLHLCTHLTFSHPSFLLLQKKMVLRSFEDENKITAVRESQGTHCNHTPYFTTHFNVKMANKNVRLVLVIYF